MIKLAIVEDSRTQRQGLERIINLWPGYRCVCACETAEEALIVLPRHEPDLVLMDIQLPGKSGIECVARLKELMPSIHVIMLTVFEDPERILSAIRAGASGYLLKRSTPDQIFNAIREVQAGGAHERAGGRQDILLFPKLERGQYQPRKTLHART
jgi:DNA-binding NarL/FixJ family response regulator